MDIGGGVELATECCAGLGVAFFLGIGKRTSVEGKRY
jgi:hypothetical protein